MADNFLEKHYEDYERRKALWQSKRSHRPARTLAVSKPDDEAL